jgi:hypothetical protein
MELWSTSGRVSTATSGPYFGRKCLRSSSPASPRLAQPEEWAAREEQNIGEATCY